MTQPYRHAFGASGVASGFGVGFVRRPYQKVKTINAMAATSRPTITSLTIDPTLWQWSNGRVGGVDVVVGRDDGPLCSCSCVVVVVGGRVTTDCRDVVVVRSVVGVRSCSFVDVELVGTSMVVDVVVVGGRSVISVVDV